MNFLHPKYRHHHNLLLFTLGLAVAVIIAHNPVFNQLITHLGSLDYVGAFMAGMLFASTFTVATGAIILLSLAHHLSPFLLIVLAAAGAVVSDFLIFKLVKDGLDEEIKPIYEEITGSHLHKIIHTKYFAWTLPVLGVLIIASPLPDELGVSLLGITHLETPKFLLISLASHTIGILVLLSASALVI